MRNAIRVCCVVLITVLLCGTVSVGAVTAYDSYRYDYWGTPLPMPAGYDAVNMVLDSHMAIGEQSTDIATGLNDPNDLFYGADGYFYIADTGNNRIVKLDTEFKCVNVFDKFTQADGSLTNLNAPSGVYVEENGDLYIADSGNRRVLICTQSGNVLGEITRPKSDIYPDNIDFETSKILRDSKGNTYVLVKNLFYGALAFNINNEFTGFYGTNRVQLTASQIAQYAWRKIFPRSMQSSQARYVPVEFTNMDIDDDGFIYTCSQTSGKSEKIKKLNAMGLNIMNESNFGDKGTSGSTGTNSETQFVDLSIDENGFINALDYRRGRVFQYDSDGQLMFVFGGSGNQIGLFSKAVAIETVGDKVYVLDSDKCSVTVFEPNTLAKTTHKAAKLYSQGLYDEAIEPWKEVLRTDSGNAFAYASLGKAYYSFGEYELAMENFKLGQDREGYSKAFREYRNMMIKENIWLILGVLLVLVSVVYVIVKRRKYASVFAKVGIHIDTSEPVKKLKGSKYIGLILKHPIDGFSELKYRKNGSYAAAWLLVLSWFILSILEYGVTGFAFNTNKVEQINIGILFISTFCVFMFWVISNWCFSTLLDGEGKMKEIFMYSAYALVPYLCSMGICTILSNVLTADEGVFITWIKMLGILWTALLLFCGMMTLHNYTALRTFFSILITFIGMVIIVFLIVLAFSLVQQMITFVSTIVREMQFRQY